MDQKVRRLAGVSPRPGPNPLRIPRAFINDLRRSQLLTDAQLSKVEEVRDECDLPTLSKLLLQMDLLTPYQLKRVMEGQPTGLVLGQYRVLGELGEGGFGKVYKAVHALMRREAAIKFLNADWAQSDEDRAMFVREVVATTQLTHPNIVTAYDANETDGVLWFAMEFVDGPSLERYVEDNGPLPIPLACRLIHQAAKALDYAHSLGFIHRDIKPANLLLSGVRTADGRVDVENASVRVVDFGLARVPSSGDSQAKSICKDGTALGTPEYIAPEQVLNGHGVDPRADLYSLGCTLYFLLTGRPPFEGAAAVETMALHLSEPPPPVTALRPDVPFALSSLILKMMAKEPEQRPQTAKEVMESLFFGIMPSAGAFAEPVMLEAPPEREAAVTPRVVRFPTVATPAAEPKALSGPIVVLWRRWAEMVEAVVTGTGPRPKEAAYKDAHGALLAAARDGPYPEVLAVVGPWVSVSAVAKAERVLGADLMSRCRAVSSRLPAVPRSSSGLLTALIAAGGVAAFAAAWWFR